MFNVEFDTKFYDIDIREIETWDSFLHKFARRNRGKPEY